MHAEPIRDCELIPLAFEDMDRARIAHVADNERLNTGAAMFFLGLDLPFHAAFAFPFNRAGMNARDLSRLMNGKRPS
jgi:hypothetical protein